MINYNHEERKAEKAGIVDSLVVAKMKKGLDLSQNDTKKILHILRQGNIKVEDNVLDIMKEIGSTLDNEYEDVEIEFETSETIEDKETKKKRKVFTTRVLNATIAKDSKQHVEQIIDA